MDVDAMIRKGKGSGGKSNKKNSESKDTEKETMTMTMTHSEKSHIGQMRAWPYRQECRGHGSTKKNLSYKGNLLLGKVCKYKLLWTECNASWLEMNSLYKRKKVTRNRTGLLLLLNSR